MTQPRKVGFFVIYLTILFKKVLVYHKNYSYVCNVRLRVMIVMNRNLEKNKVRLFRVDNRCNKHKHTPVTNDFGVTWCKDCGTLINKF